jgi:hypothetical protein
MFAASNAYAGLTSLTKAQLNNYLGLYNDSSSSRGIFGNFGKVMFVPTSYGFTVTCQCAGIGTVHH